MQYIVILVVIWLVISFIYSKVKKETFLASLILVPLAIIKFFFKEAASSSFSEVEREAKKQGRDDVLGKIEEVKSKYNDIAKSAQNAETRIKEKGKNDE